MPKKTSRASRSKPKLSSAETAAEATRKALKRSIARARDIKRLSRQLQRLNDEAQGELLALARHVADRSNLTEPPMADAAPCVVPECVALATQCKPVGVVAAKAAR